MEKALSSEDYARIKDLKRVYGNVGVATLIDVPLVLVERALAKQDVPFAVHSGVKRYWKKWMQALRSA